MSDPNVGELLIDRFCGPETYPVKRATWSLYRDDELDQMTLTVRVDAGRGTKLHEDTEHLYAEPWWEISVVEKELTRPEISAGSKFSVPNGYDEFRGGHLTNFYYCSHEPSDANHVEVLAIDGDRLLLRLTGETIDVNFYDGSKAPARLFAETWFLHDAGTTRSVA